jgi:hypothetical protein
MRHVGQAGFAQAGVPQLAKVVRGGVTLQTHAATGASRAQVGRYSPTQGVVLSKASAYSTLRPPPSR